MATRSLTVAIGALLALPFSAQAAHFTYHGSLMDGDAPAQGAYDLRVRSFAQPGDVAPLGEATELPAVKLVDGAFSVDLDLPEDADGTTWVEVAVRAAGSGAAFEKLGDPQPLAKANSACPGAWAIDGNTGLPAGSFLGIADPASTTPLEFKAANARIAAFLPAGTPAEYGFAPNIVLGSPNNTAVGRGATVGGGGSTLNAIGGNCLGFCRNRAGDDFAVVAGGFSNTADDFAATVSGGESNFADGYVAVIAGGSRNRIDSAQQAAIGGGVDNRIIASDSVISGGRANLIDGAGSGSVIGGGHENLVSGSRNVVGGGVGNAALYSAGVIGGGTGNTIRGHTGTISGGSSNNVLADTLAGTIAGGTGNLAGEYGFVAGGSGNLAGKASFAGGTRARVRLGGAAPVTLPDNASVEDYAGAASPNGDAGTFVWADTTFSPFRSSGPGQFLIRATGGVGINTSTFGNAANLRLSEMVIRNPDAGGNVDLTLINQTNRGYGVASIPGAGGAAGDFYISETDARTSNVVFTNRFRIDAAGTTFVVGGAVGNLSDARLKKNFAPIDAPLDALLALRGQMFEYTDPAKSMNRPGPRMGFVAQQVQQVIPQWVAPTGPDGYLAVTPAGFEALVVEAMRDLKAEHDVRLEQLEAENRALQARLDRLERRAER